MNKKTLNLENRLLYLSALTLSRIEFWLTYRGIKLASTTPLRNKFTTKNAATKRIVKWLEDADLYYVIDKKHKDMIHISKDKALAEKMAKIQWSEDPKDIIFRGNKYGFPINAVKAFAKDLISMGDYWEIRERIMKYPYWHYARYRVRSGHEFEDLQVAKKWATIIRKEVPKLAKWFEKDMEGAKSK